MRNHTHPERRIDSASRHLEAAVAQLEPVLAGAGGAEAHEAVGLIMEALQRLNEAHGRIASTQRTAGIAAAE